MLRFFSTLRKVDVISLSINGTATLEKKNSFIHVLRYVQQCRGPSELQLLQLLSLSAAHPFLINPLIDLEVVMLFNKCSKNTDCALHLLFGS